MPVEAATNCWTKAEEAVVQALPELAAFQALTETTTATDAAAFVFADELRHPDSGEAYTEDEIKEIKHYAIVGSANQNGYRITRAGVVGDLFVPSGSLVFSFDRMITNYEEQAEETDKISNEQTERSFKNRIGDLIAQLVDYLDTNSGPWAESVSVVDGPFHNHEEMRPTSGHWQGVEVSMAWGVKR